MGRAIISLMPIHTDLFYIIAALLLGAVAGMRTMLAPAAVALTLWRRPELAPRVAPGSWLALPFVAVLLIIAALAELVGDKLPRTPNRTALAPFLARVISGGVVGAVVMQTGHMHAWLGALAGVVGAVVSTIGMFNARRAFGARTGIADPYVGALEDVIALAIAATVLAMLVGA